VNLFPVTSKRVPEQIQTIDVAMQVWDQQTFTVTSKHVQDLSCDSFKMLVVPGTATSIVPSVICETTPLTPQRVIATIHRQPDVKDGPTLRWVWTAECLKN
jgi:hypothetical protein